MLTTLRIKNLALVEDLTIEFQPGYNVITGETGAGKSLLIGALNLVLGERADRTLIRTQAESCSVEAAIEAKDLKTWLTAFLEENGLEPVEDGQLVLKRTFSTAGVNRQFINGSPTTLAVLAALGERLVDIHGPHDHQSLLHQSAQLAILDAFGELDEEREAFAALVRERGRLEAEKAALIVDEKTYTEQLELLRFQATEIETANLNPEAEEAVEHEHRRAGNVARLLELSQTALELIGHRENSLMTEAGHVGRIVQEIARLDSAAAGLLRLQGEVVTALSELQAELSRYAEKVEVDPQRLQFLEERLNLLQSLKRKYGATVADILAFGAAAGEKLNNLEQRDAELTKINARLAQGDLEILRAGKHLSASRAKAIPRLRKAVMSQLADLGFKQSEFDVALQQLTPKSPKGDLSDAQPASRFTSTGFDEVEFQFSPNPGEPLRQLRAIASSGELARVMLALKTVLAAEDEIPVLVFDEVDANVGGETAHAIGEKMQQIARNRQVLCITHLPQVAAPASAHFLATKRNKAGRTISEISLLDKDERVAELTRMLGGQTEAARKHAAALLG